MVALAVAPGVFGVLRAGECPGFLGDRQRERERATALACVPVGKDE